MDILERFLTYVKIDTSSKRGADTVPSALHEFDLAHELAYELKELNVKDVCVDNHCFVYAKIPASAGYEKATKLGLIAHLDTHPDCSSEKVNPKVWRSFSGQDILLEENQVISVEEFPHLKELQGKTLITSDGTTLLGADDKAGIAEIIDAVSRILKSDRPHGPLRIAFIPDEEIGRGTAFFNNEIFDADVAYTIDGYDVGEIVNENFNAISAHVEVRGVDAHIGEGFQKLVNSQMIALELANSFPIEERPETTKEREGFFHLRTISGTVKSTIMEYVIRDFTMEGMKGRVDHFNTVIREINKKYGAVAEVSYFEEYKNMKSVIDEHPKLVERAADACRRVGTQPVIRFARGGTDGARLSHSGLPCPNLGTGGYAYHSFKEHITLEAMEKVSDILTELIYDFAEDSIMKA